MMNSRHIRELQLRIPWTRIPLTSQLSRRFGSASTYPNPSRSPSRWPRRLIYAGIFGALGVGTGKWVESMIHAPPLPGSIEDQAEMQQIQRRFTLGLPIVQELRENPDYVETDAYEDFSVESKAERLTSGALAGSRGLALQKIFWNDKEQKVVSVVFFGPGLEGWPTMVHGGALGTVIDENLGRVAIRHFPARTGVTANLNINYRAPVDSQSFYSLHTTLDQARSTDRKAFAKCEVRDMRGRLCVEATGLFVVPKTLELQKVGEHF